MFDDRSSGVRSQMIFFLAAAKCMHVDVRWNNATMMPPSRDGMAVRIWTR